MPDVDVREAQALFETLLEGVERGESVVITRNGKPVARLSKAGRFTPRAHLRTEEEKQRIRQAAQTLAEIQARQPDVPFDWKEAVEEGRE
ncbi:MAG: type II toxin-antitoxin system prevent-host-death family antitoxin [Hyphomonadaceae bacterium]|nr:type II toxin-antitoxin system prevent-host-death family antitoxin [Hyphomonadaceae bacterium]